jgi:hypothetical protein
VLIIIAAAGRWLKYFGQIHDVKRRDKLVAIAYRRQWKRYEELEHNQTNKQTNKQ